MFTTIKNPRIPEHFRTCLICAEDFDWEQPQEQNKFNVDKHVNKQSNQDALHPRTRSEIKKKQTNSGRGSNDNNKNRNDSNYNYNQNYNRLPVASKECQHFLCYGCLLQHHAHQSHGKQVRKFVNCPFCMAQGAFRPDKPVFNTVLMEWIKTAQEEERNMSPEKNSNDKKDDQNHNHSDDHNDLVVDDHKDEDQNKVVIEIKRNNCILKPRFREILYEQVRKIIDEMWPNLMPHNKLASLSSKRQFQSSSTSFDARGKRQKQK